ncbi:unnamed protein product [Lampetra planeri]
MRKGPAGVATPREEDALAALVVADRREGATGGHRPEQQWRVRPPRSQGSAPTACFGCSQQGYIVLGYRNPPRDLHQGLFFVFRLHVIIGFWASGESRRIHHSAAPLTRLI